MFKRLVIAKALLAGFLATGCATHGGGFNNQGAGVLLGGLTGSVVGNQFGKGTGKTAATAIGAVIGALAGGEVGRSMDQLNNVVASQPPEAYRHNRHNGYYSLHSGRCGRFTNHGVRSACKRGESEKERAEQRRREREAYNYGRSWGRRY